METIKVSNFLNLKHIEFDLCKINIFIGPQAQGKSILAKLTYLFKLFLLNYRKSILTERTKKDFDRNFLKEFELIFPAYSWQNQDFEIIYRFDRYEVSLRTKKLATGKRKPILEYSEELSKIRSKINKIHQKDLSDVSPTIQDDTEFRGFRLFEKNQDIYLDQLLSQYLFTSEINKPILQSAFIPAGRSFFANVQKNIFSFLQNNIPIDYFLTQFGASYETVKFLYLSWYIYIESKSPQIHELMNQIIGGYYSYKKEEDWIYSTRKPKNGKEDRKINLSNASSGQQEALPMTIILAILPFCDPNRFFFIEEPEAHLFPTSQKHIINLISLVFNLTEKRHGFFITTHSPYILTALNNLIQASNTLKALQQKPDSENQREKLLEIVPENQMLDINDLGVYAVRDGILENIINPETNLIDTNIIDGVSNEFSNTFEKLLNLEFGE